MRGSGWVEPPCVSRLSRNSHWWDPIQASFRHVFHPVPSQHYPTRIRTSGDYSRGGRDHLGFPSLLRKALHLQSFLQRRVYLKDTFWLWNVSRIHPEVPYIYKYITTYIVIKTIAFHDHFRFWQKRNLVTAWCYEPCMTWLASLFPFKPFSFKCLLPECSIWWDIPAGNAFWKEGFVPPGSNHW